MKTPAIGLVAVCLTGLLLFPEGAPAADKKKKKKSEPEEQSTPKTVPELRSQASATPVQMYLSNYTGRPVELVWVDTAGGRQSYGQWPPMQAGTKPSMIQTYAGHVWLFKSDGRVVQTYTATTARQQSVTVGNAPPAGTPSRAVVVDAPRPAPIRDVPAPMQPSKGGDQVPAGAVEFLQVHNDARARVGAPAIRWSDALARYAQQWADQLASSGTFQHRDQTKNGYGENLFGGSAGFTPADAARHWLKERAAYQGGPVTPANFNTVGHYTQMVWSGSTEVGYGVATGSNGVVVVANYAPGGNHSGQKPY